MSVRKSSGLAAVLAAITAAATPGMNVLRVAASALDTETVTVGDHVWEASYDGVASGSHLLVDLSTYGTKANLTLTSNGTNVSDGATVTVGSIVYRFKDTMAQAYDVKIGADAATSLANLKKAINATGTAGTEYYAGTLVNAVASAGAITSTTLVVTALVTGTGGNSIAVGETSATLSWTGGGVTLANGANPTAEDFVDAFVAAVNASATVIITAVKISANEVLCYTKKKNQSPAAAETLTGSNNAWAASTFFAGDRPDGLTAHVRALKRTATAVEVALQTMHFVFGFTVTGAVIQVRNTDGTLKAVDGALTISGQRVTWASSGSTDIDADDVVTVLAF